MVNLIIVEDEPIMNKFIVNSIDYQSLGINLAGSFFSVDDAFDFLQNNPVDLVVTDIKMPKIDGITFIDTALKLYPELKFIVLSNFDDYSLVKKAFKLGIYDYILKIDFEPETFSSLLKRIVADICENKKSKSAAERLSLKKQFWNGKLGVRDRVGVIKITNYNDIVTREWEMDREILNYGVCNFVDEIISEYDNIDYFQNNYDEFIFIINSEKTSSLINICETFFDKIINFLKEYSKLDAVGGIYDLNVDIAYAEQYSLASDIINYHFLFDDLSFFTYSKYMNYNDEFDFDKCVTNFKDSFDKFDYEKCCRLLTEIQALKVNRTSLNQLLMFYKMILSMTVNRFNTDKEIPSFNKASGYHNYLINALSATDDSSPQNNASILEVINYIDKNYHKPLTLLSLSEEFQFEYAELSRKLKYAIGMSFKKYITSIRMQEAINLIKTTDFKITEIAEMVGYLNYEHFSRSFKSFFNKWPNEIRKGK